MFNGDKKHHSGLILKIVEQTDVHYNFQSMTIKSVTNFKQLRIHQETPVWSVTITALSKTFQECGYQSVKMN